MFGGSAHSLRETHQRVLGLHPSLHLRDVQQLQRQQSEHPSNEAIRRTGTDQIRDGYHSPKQRCALGQPGPYLKSTSDGSQSWQPQ